MISRHLIVSGRVQGVGFRWSTLKLAENMKLSGWVANLTNGDVEIVVQGAQPEVESFIEQIRQGPTPYARIRSCQVKSGVLGHYQGFTVR